MDLDRSAHRHLHTLGVVVLFAALTAVMAWPVGTHPAGYRLGGGADPSLYIWTIGWATHALTHAPWAIFDANIFFPYPYTLAYSENLIGSAALALPAMWLTGDVVAATNIAALLSVVLCGVGAWFLARTLGLSMPAAIVCGLIFAFAPPRFGRLSQLHLTAIQWVPFGLAFVHRYFTDHRARDLRWALAMLSLQALTSGHGAALLVLGGAIVTGFSLLGGVRPAVRVWIRDAGLVGALALLPAALAFLPYWLARRDVSLDRVFDDTGVAWSSYVSSPSYVQQWILTRLPDWAWLRAEPDLYMFPGVLVLILVALAFRSGVGGPRRTYAWMTVVTLWMTIGPPLTLWRWVYWLPGLNFIRVPSRFWLLGMLALAVLAALGFEHLTRRWPALRRAVAAAAVAVLLLGEFAMPIDARPFALDTAAVDRWLDTQPKPFAIAEVPVSSSRADSRRAEMATQYMLHSLAHHQPTVFGFSGAEPATYKPLYDSLIDFPTDSAIEHLTALGVTYVVVHPEYLAEEAREDYLASFDAFADRLTLVHQDGLGRVYRLPAGAPQ